MSVKCGRPDGASQNAIISSPFLHKENSGTACRSLFVHRKKYSGIVYENCLGTDPQREDCRSLKFIRYDRNMAEATPS